MTVVTKASMRVINGCLIVALVSSLLPQLLPSLQGISGILLIGSGIVAFCAYLFGQTASEASLTAEVRRHADQSAHAVQEASVDATIQGASDVFADQMPVDEVFYRGLARWRSVIDEPTVWRASEFVDFDTLANTNLNRTIHGLHGRRRLKTGAVFLWFDEKNSNLQIAPIGKVRTKVPRSLTPFVGLQAGRSRTVH